jgi:glucosamine--fructose-6-phosphate aminotransferase (isomerizing)
MCGIIGYLGGSQDIVSLDGLSCLEYREYDSAGIAVLDGDDIRVYKTAGRNPVLSSL